jgi:cell wall-associated NlpC family hydrolase
MGSNSFIHASSSNGVVYDNLDEEYYKKHFAGIRRIF